MQIRNRQVLNICYRYLYLSIFFLFAFSSTTAAQTNSSLHGQWHFEDYQGGWVFQDNGAGLIYTASGLATAMSYRIYDQDLMVFIIGDSSHEYKLYHIDLFTNSILMLHDFETFETLVLFRGDLPPPISVLSGKDLLDGQWTNGENTLEFFENGQMNWGIDNPMAYTMGQRLEIKSGGYILPFEFLYLDQHTLIFRRSDLPDRYVAYFKRTPADIDAKQLVGKWEAIKPEISGAIYDFAADGSVALLPQSVVGRYMTEGSDLVIQANQNHDSDNQKIDLHLIVDYVDQTVLVFHDRDDTLLDSKGKPVRRFVMVNQDSGIFCYTRCTE